MIWVPGKSQRWSNLNGPVLTIAALFLHSNSAGRLGTRSSQVVGEITCRRGELPLVMGCDVDCVEISVVAGCRLNAEHYISTCRLYDYEAGHIIDWSQSKML